MALKDQLRHKSVEKRQQQSGDMGAVHDQLWETTLNPATRRMKQVEIEDARMASEVTGMLMGTLSLA